MIEAYPNSWNFRKFDKNLISPNGLYKIEYGELYEIAMGAPIGGQCFLIREQKKFELNLNSGGPIIWNKTSNKIRLPIWTKSRMQKIQIVEIDLMIKITYKNEFRVLHFKDFTNNFLIGIDSPIYMSKEINFEIDKEEIESFKTLK